MDDPPTDWEVIRDVLASEKVEREQESAQWDYLWETEDENLAF